MKSKFITSISAAALLFAGAGNVWGTSGLLEVHSNTKLTEDHDGEIVITADNLTLNCGGHTISGPGPRIGFTIGINLTDRTDVTVKNCNIIDFSWGVLLANSEDNIVKNNTASGNSVGFILIGSSDNALKKNTATGNEGLGFTLEASSENSLKKNMATGNGVGFNLETMSNGNVLKKNSACSNLEADAVKDASSTGNIFLNNEFCVTNGL